MKKRFKLVITIVSFFLAVGLMTFGVIAAQSVQFAVTNTVSYVCRDVFVDFFYQVGYATTPLETPYTATSARAELYTMQEPTGNESSYTGSGDSLRAKNGDVEGNWNVNKQIDCSFGKTNGTAMKVMITMTNSGKQDAYYRVDIDSTFVQNVEGISYYAVAVPPTLLSANGGVGVFSYYIFMEKVDMASITEAVTSAIPNFIITVSQNL